MTRIHLRSSSSTIATIPEKPSLSCTSWEVTESAQEETGGEARRRLVRREVNRGAESEAMKADN